MNKAQIIADLRERQQALSDQLADVEDGDDDEGSTWDAEVEAKLDLVNDLLGEYTKKPKKTKNGKNNNTRRKRR